MKELTSEAEERRARRVQVEPSAVVSSHAAAAAGPRVAVVAARGDGMQTTVTLTAGGCASAARSTGGT